MAQTLLKKRPFKEHRRQEDVQEPFEELQTRLRKDIAGTSTIKFKSIEAEIKRLQSICDQIVDLLTNLGQIDQANPKGLAYDDAT